LNIENLIFSPEFSREGLALHDCLYPSRIIVGDEAKQSNAFAQLLKDICVNENVPALLMASSEAEAVKLFSNTYLAMRVSFFNELDSYAIQKGLNTLNVISGVELDPRIGSTYNNPSFGFGGYCLPKDSKELSVSYGLLPKDLIGSINESNQNRINFIVEDILRKNLKTIGVYRLQMKRDSDNLRNSPVIGVVRGLLGAGASVVIYSPLVKEEKFLNSPVLKDLSEFKQRADLIVANRLDDDLSDVIHKVYSRDVKQGGVT
jgi:UDPglucose 6-dehydrogenase